MEAWIRAAVWKRAGDCCEYCGLPQALERATFHVEHIIPSQHGGSDALENLALACHLCNLHKGTNLTSIDPGTAKLVSLFHPRRQRWKDHFQYVDGKVEGITTVGRVTVNLLKMNLPRRIRLRLMLWD